MTASDPLVALREAIRAIAELEGLAGQEPFPRDQLRAWAMKQFGQLIRLEQQLGQKPAAAPAARTPERPPPAEKAVEKAAPRSPASAESLWNHLAQVAQASRADTLGAALGALLQLTGAQRGFLAVTGPDGALRFPAARAFGTLDMGSPEAQLSRSILRAAMGGPASLLIDDAGQDAQFGQQRSVLDLALKAVLVVPLRTQDRAFGVLYLDNPVRAGAFDEEARRAAEAFAQGVAPLLARELLLRRQEERKAERLARLRREHHLSGLLGQSDALLEVLEQLLRVAPTDVAVLVTGETGTGKEAVARALHQNSRRAQGPFVAVNCGAISPELVESELFGHERGAFTGAVAQRAGHFEQADGGTLFLDEIGELPLAAQAKLLRVLQDGTFFRVGSSTARKVDVRVVAATHRDLKQEAAQGRFREDLRFRIDVVRIHVPPLRERDEDVARLAQAFAQDFAKAHSLTPRRLGARALALLEGHPWPGNVRELRNAVERAVVLSQGEELGPEALPPDIAGVAQKGPEGLKEAVRAYRGRLVERAFEAAQGKHDEAARLLGVNPKYLYKLLKDLREGHDTD
jgi:DNA-binding NtrC family response regulator